MKIGSLAAAAIFGFTTLLGQGGVLNAAEIKVLSGAAVKPVMSELIPPFERSSGHKVTIDYAPTAPVIVNRIEKGEAVDVAIATQQGIASLVKQGRVTGGNAVDIAKVGIGVMVRKGAPKPDISSVEAFKRTLLAAKSIGHGDPDREGRTAVYVSDCLAAWISPRISNQRSPLFTRQAPAKASPRGTSRSDLH
jgi:molybdate transport system substrate-binding protein